MEINTKAYIEAGYVVDVTVPVQTDSNWILASGQWNDAGEWDDTENWQDS